MCGLAGVLDFAKSRSSDDLSRIVEAMGDAVRHRGPDEGGQWVDAEAGIAIAHRRLSIQDLSEAGRQPMVSSSGRYVLAYNGEIYNSRDLRKELKGSFRGLSDTETLLEALSEWGVSKTLPRLVGMFAFALWDREQRTLTLARDRMGIKPLYWGRQGERVFFASELKSLFAHPNFQASVDRAALSDLVSFNYVSGPQSIFADVSQLEPGCFVRIDADTNALMTRYWDVCEAYAHGQENRLKRSDAEILEQFDDLLKEAVRGRMVSDVSIGTFLSGGVDSSIITAVMQGMSSSPVKTFTIGFGEGEFNEANHAREIAKHLGTDHHELQVSSSDALDVIPKLSSMYCEPFADSSQIPTHLVSEMARRNVTVALSGDGGDEVFAGYNRHLAGHEMWSRMSGVPVPLRQCLAKLLKFPSHMFYDRLATLLPERRRPSQMGDKMMKFAGLMGSVTLDDFYAQVVRSWNNEKGIVINGHESLSWMDNISRAAVVSGPVERMQVMDMLTYLSGDILTKVDRASMAVGLEARVPLLDHRIVEFSASLPMNMKIRDGQTKWLLRRVLDNYVPRELIERPKQGFAVPLGDWLRGPLRDWAEDLLSEKSLTDAGLFHAAPVRKKWLRHLKGQHHEHHDLWSILMAQDWWRRWMSQSHGGE